MLDAEAKIGELLSKTELPGRGGGDTKASNIVVTRLKDIGLTKQRGNIVVTTLKDTRPQARGVNPRLVTRCYKFRNPAPGARG